MDHWKVNNKDYNKVGIMINTFSLKKLLKQFSIGVSNHYYRYECLKLGTINK